MILLDKDILTEIEHWRNEMILLAMETSFSNTKVLEISTKLDQLLNQYELNKEPEVRLD
ncbi:aspartyl-phosphate phosphatase Spo0E family protein [Bacillus sp. FJAT-42315]|uniref:aspartyl-phosphate phosphatase Spo0E family protein n=1 Tax=Bacillus sp. FJAT-42315 TaxID=2014077 RepID=UPI000C231728|nr:aspartyl-phosphate phosphatase Spo0E family protein [Bacillus sp. FJAT-42315]